jgi:8-oxo-dGTP pyrophosphatase MutT (NUDIX family)
MSDMKQAAVVLVIRKNGEILVTTNRRYGQYALPGGKVDETDASPRAAASRELEEETALRVAEFDLSFLFAGINTVKLAGTDEDCYVHVFLAREVAGEPRDVEEGTRHAWMSFYRLLQSSVFAPFYKRHMPDGVGHLMTTRGSFIP